MRILHQWRNETKPSNQTVGQLLFFSFYGKIALWPVSYMMKIFVVKMLGDVYTKVFTVTLPDHSAVT